ncbi:MAG: ABC transporter substrate-binding protein [Pseudomonadota bacterium]
MKLRYSKLSFYALCALLIVGKPLSAIGSTNAQSSNAAITHVNVATVESVEEVTQENPFEMIQNVASNTFERMKSEQSNIQSNPEVLRDIMEQELMPYIDYRFSAYKVLGKYARSLKRKELHEFVSVFRQYLITSYAVAMGYYDDQTVEFEPAVDYGKRTDVTVRAVIVDDVRPDIKVAFKVRKDKKTNRWSAYDMVAEGISLLSSKQSEFEAVIRKDGIQEVISLMRKTIDKPITLQGQAQNEAAE